MISDAPECQKTKIEWGDVGIAPYTVKENRQNVGADAHISP